MTIDRHGRVGLPQIALRGQALKNVEEFKYLGSYFTSRPTERTPKVKKNQKKKEKLAGHPIGQPEQKENVAERIKPKKKRVTKKAPPKKSSFLTKNLEHRISKAEGAFYGYAAPLFRRKEVPIRSKVLIFKITAIPTLLYGSEIWSPTTDEIQRLESWQNRCLRYMLGIRYSTHGHVPSYDLRRKCRLPKIETRLRQGRLRWFGHAARMSAERLPRKMLTARLGTNRPRGRPRKNWRQTISADLKSINSYESYPEDVKDRTSWRAKIKGP